MSEEIKDSVLEEVSGGQKKDRRSAKVIGTVTVVNCKDWCHIRKNATMTGEILGKATPGTIYEYYGWYGDWAEIKYGSGKAFINKKFIKEN